MTDLASRTAPPNLVQISEQALAQIQKLMQEDPSATQPGKGLRLGVQGGGCSGLSYKIAFDDQQANDYVMDIANVTVFIDPKSAIYLKGIVLDYQGGLEGKGFVFQNPNATATCGCGESFSI